MLWVLSRRQDSSILSDQVANNSTGFGSLLKLEVTFTVFLKSHLTLIACYFLFTAASQLMSQKLKTTYKASTSKVTGKQIILVLLFLSLGE